MLCFHLGCSGSFADLTWDKSGGEFDSSEQHCNIATEYTSVMLIELEEGKKGPSTDIATI